MTEPIRSIGPMRRIAHLDMDAFYASVELLRYPDLRGQPVVIGGRSADQPVTQSDGTRTYARLKDYVGRGVTTTSTYEARALGVFSGMGVMKAAKLAPEAILLPIDFAAYPVCSKQPSPLSHRILKIVASTKFISTSAKFPTTH